MGNAENKSTVLIVDDIATNIDVLSAILLETYDVKVALSGSNALEIAAAEPHPDIILLDVMMPEMNGYEVCQKLKSDPSTSEIPVLFVTALDESQFEVQGFSAKGLARARAGYLLHALFLLGFAGGLHEAAWRLTHS